MKIKVSDYIAKFLVENNIHDLFTVTGGGAMHLNDSFGHQKDLKCTYFHHEQACSMAAEGYYRSSLKTAAVCVTTGPGGTNTLTGVLGAYLDSIPMFVVSGQVRYDTTVESTNLNLREYGDQEFNICNMAKHATKYAVMVKDANKIKYELEKAFNIMNEGRKGPVWLDIPLNIQASTIDTDNLESFNKNQLPKYPQISKKDLEDIIEKIKNAKRPVIYAGSAIRLNGGYENFQKLIKKLNIPVVCAINAIDSIEHKNNLYVGIGGINGDRPGNFAVQNSDFILSIGCRLSFRQVGFNYKTWAREAYVVMVDIDSNELNKPSLHVDKKICMDVNQFIDLLIKNVSDKIFNNKSWIEQCQLWRKKYPVVLDKYYEENPINVYAFIKYLSSNLKNNTTIVSGNGAAFIVMSQCGFINKGVKHIVNSGVASMGYGLPASIGAIIANDNKDVVCITGDGSIQMNIQELQTIITNKLKLKIFIINNDGYHSIRQTQTSFFDKNFVGIGPDSNDLSFPSFEKISFAYGYDYYKINDSLSMEKQIIDLLNKDTAFICEVFVSKTQNFLPKCSSKKLDDGKMVSCPLEDLYPFLNREELKENMYIDLVKE